MSNSFIRFGQRNDLLGKQVQLHYKSAPNYGTVFGGYCSILARLFIWSLALAEIWSCFTDPVNTQTQSFKSLTTPNTQQYTISLDQGFPAFYIVSPSKTGDSLSFNDQTLFNYYFFAASNLKNETIAALPCSEVIPKYVEDEVVQNEILMEFNSNDDKTSPIFLCPDTPNFTLFVDQWITFGSYEYNNFLIVIESQPLPTDPTEAQTMQQRIDMTSVQTSFVYPYYNPQKYHDNDHHLSYASLSYQTNYYDGPNHPQNSFYLIQKTTLNIFTNIWLDLSALNFGNFAQVYETYQPETQQPNVNNFAPYPTTEFYIAFTLGRNQIKTKWMR